MTNYCPNKWVVVKISVDGKTLHKVFGTWWGGYLHGDSWRLNSGIKAIFDDGDYVCFEGFSGSTYRCHKDMYGASAYTGGVLQSMVDETNGAVEILDEKTDWLALCSE